MPEPAGGGAALSLLSLREVRRYIRRSHAVAMTFAFVIAYALGSMVLGGMLVFAPIPGGYTFDLLWGNALGLNPWNYPGLLIVAPWGVVSLPFFATLSMVVVSIGVGIGMAVAVLLVAALLRSRRAHHGPAASAGSVAGLTPAMIALVTLGACCSTTAAATAGVGLVASVSGSSVDNLLTNNWYLGLFQMVVVWVALLAQEMILRVYGGILGISGPSVGAVEPAPALDRWRVAGTLLRAALLIGGITWSLVMFVEWAQVDPATAPAGIWAWWILEHQVPALLAILTAFFPGTVYRAFTRDGPLALRYGLRALASLSGVLLLIGVPPPLSGWGLEGGANELLYLVGAPASWGSVAPVAALGGALLFRWLFQYLLLGGFALLAGLAPEIAFRPFLGAAPREATDADFEGRTQVLPSTDTADILDAPPAPRPNSESRALGSTASDGR